MEGQKKRGLTIAEIEMEAELRDADRLKHGGTREVKEGIEEQRRSAEADLSEEQRKKAHGHHGLSGGILQSLSHGIEGRIETISPIIKGQIQDVKKGISTVGISL